MGKKCDLSSEIGLDNGTLLIAYRLQGLSQEEIGRKMGVSQQTISRWMSEVKIEGLDEWKVHKADILSLVQKNIIDHLKEGKFREMSGRDLAFALDKLNNMERLERGRSTSIRGYEEIEKEKEKLEAERCKVLERLREWEEKKRTLKGKRVREKAQSCGKKLDKGGMGG